MNNPQQFQKLGRIVGFVGFAGIAASNCIYDVQGGSRAVIFDRLQGVKSDVVGEGTHFLFHGCRSQSSLTSEASQRTYPPTQEPRTCKTCP